MNIVTITQCLFEAYESSESFRDETTSPFYNYVRTLLLHMFEGYWNNEECCGGFKTVYDDLLGKPEEIKIAEGIIRTWLDPAYDGSEDAQVEFRLCQLLLAVDWYEWRCGRFKRGFDKTNTVIRSDDLEGAIDESVATKERLEKAKIALQPAWTAVEAAITRFRASKHIHPLTVQ